MTLLGQWLCDQLFTLCSRLDSRTEIIFVSSSEIFIGPGILCTQIRCMVAKMRLIENKSKQHYPSCLMTQLRVAGSNSHGTNICLWIKLSKKKRNRKNEQLNKYKFNVVHYMFVNAAPRTHHTVLILSVGHRFLKKEKKLK